MMKNIFALATAAALSACATTPDVTYNYYLPTSKTTVSVKQTIKCTADKKNLIITYDTPTVTTTYFADTSKAYPIDVKLLDSPLADSSFMLKRAIDGRLSNIDASWTGQGQAIVTAAVSLAKTVSVLGAGPTKPGACDAVLYWGGDSKSVALVYSASLDMSAKGHENLEVARDMTSSAIYEAIKATGQTLPPLSIWVTLPPKPDVAVSETPGANSQYKVRLALRSTERAEFEIRESTIPLYVGNAVVPKTGDHYDIPIPGGVPFGNNKFGITLDDSGAVTAIDYNKDSGTAAVLNAVNGVASAATPPAGP
jgi:hypothetical protein